MNRAQTLGIMAAIIYAGQPCPPQDAVQQAARLLDISEAHVQTTEERQ